MIYCQNSSTKVKKKTPMVDNMHMELVVQPSYIPSVVDMSTVLSNLVGYEVEIDREVLEEHRKVVSNYLKTVDEGSTEAFVAEDYLSSLDDLEELDGKELTFGCDAGPKKQIELFCNYVARDIKINGRLYSTSDVLVVEHTIEYITAGASGYVIHIDFKRVYDWLAFEVGHASYDPYEYSARRISEKLSNHSPMLHLTPEFMDKLVPANFAEELSEFMVDFGTSSIYAGRDRVAYNYFRNAIAGKDNKGKQRQVKFENLIYWQNNIVTAIICHYLSRVNQVLQLPIKIIGIGDGIVDIFVAASPSANKLIKDVRDGMTVKVFDCYTAEFKPNFKLTEV